MNFGRALDMLLSCPKYKYIRERAWNYDVKIFLVQPDSTNKTRYLRMEFDDMIIPWIPNMIEMCINDDWEVHIDDSWVVLE